MSTDIAKLHLPRHKQYNWHLVFKHWRIARKARMVLTTILIGLVLYSVDGWLNETLRRLDAEHALLDNQGWMLKSINFGAPGWTWSGDWTDPQVRKPK